MRHNKFLIFMNRDFEYSIHLAKVDYHKNIKTPPDTAARCGGGWWSIDQDSGVLRLSGDSFDFGKYDMEAAQKAFDAKQVFYFGENCFEEFELKNLQLC